MRALLPPPLFYMCATLLRVFIELQSVTKWMEVDASGSNLSFNRGIYISSI